MGHIVEMKNFPGRRAKPDQAKRAAGAPTLLMFTGVRYERIAERPAVAAKLGKAGRPPRKSA